jgi:hypothetical protein
VVVKAELQRAQIWGGSHSTSHIIDLLPNASLFFWLTCSLCHFACKCRLCPDPSLIQTRGEDLLRIP